MTKEFIEESKKNEKEYYLGIYKEGRYAWILSNVVPLSQKISVKGKLGLWEYKS